ncbi:MAG TPA: lipid-binding SYLF domain-containing protein [Hanamia sp.]
MKISKTSPLFLSLIFICFIFTTARSQDTQDTTNKQEDKIEKSIQVLKDFSDMKENIPQELLKVTQGIIVVPKLINAGFVLAGKRGKGIAMVKMEDGTWSNPVFVTITGGSVGFQIGVQAVDLVLIFKNRETLQDIGKGSFTLGSDISVTAGPVGRSSTASTDYKLEAEVYSYSRSKGLFAGISLGGSAIAVDAKANEVYYGNDDDAKTIFSDTDTDESDAVKELKDTLRGMYE